MKWIPGAGRAEDEQLEADYEKSTVQGKFRLGETYLFRKKALGVWYLAWREILWAYRQGEDVQSRLCCGTTNYEVEHLILVTEGGRRTDIRLEEKQDAETVLAGLPAGTRLRISGFLLRKRKNIRIEKNTVKLLKYGRASQYFFLWQRVG